MYSIPETMRNDSRKDFQVLIPTSEVIAISLPTSFFYYLILTMGGCRPIPSTSVKINKNESENVSENESENE